MTDPAYEVLCDTSDRERWLALRRTGIGGSDAPAILGLVGWASPASIQADKWGLLPDDEAEAEILKWGRRMEPVISAGLAEDEGWELQPFGKLIRSTVHEFMLCTPDSIRADGMFVQIKNTMLADKWVETPPARVWVQCQHELAVSGAPTCVAAALVMGNRLKWAYVDRDDDFIDGTLIPAEREFWRLTEDLEPAHVDGSEHTRKAYQHIWPEDSGETVLLDGHFTDLDFELQEVKEQRKALEAREDQIQNEFRLAIKDATFGVLPNGVTYSLKTQTSKEHVVKESTFRVLRRKAAKR